MKKYSVRQYAELIGKTKPWIMKMIHSNTLPKGVKFEKIDTFYIIYVS